jgi:transposase
LGFELDNFMEDRSMPAAIPLPIRECIWRRWQAGESVPRLAADLQLPPRTVRNLVRRFAQKGPEGLTPDYERCATRKLPEDSDTFRKAVDYRQRHPRWGGGLIRVMLHEEQQPAPSTRTLQRWFQRLKLSPAPPGRRSTLQKRRASQPHEVWQMDAVDQLRLASSQRVSWLRVVDECSGAVLQTRVFPPGFLEHRRADPGAGSVAQPVRHLGDAGTLSR